MTEPAARIERRLRAAGDPDRALQEKRYLKSRLEHYGVSVPVIRRIAREIWREAEGLPREPLLASVEALWARPVHECRMAAVELLELGTDALVPEDIALIERLSRESGTWALVDGLAASVVAPLVERRPELGTVLDRWAVDDDFWLRRRKAIGWVLRDTARRRPGLVADWLDPRAALASGVTVREAVKYLPEDRRERILDRHRASAGRAGETRGRE